MKKNVRLKELIDKGEVIVAAGCYDGVSAKLVEKTGFEVAYMTGYGAAATVLGMPDYGFMTMNEMVTHAGNISAAISIPLIADADTGYGNPLNVMRTVREYERAGISAIHIEDQLFPKRCGHMEGKVVIPMEEHCKKIEMAVATRKSMLIIARTDARAPLGLEEALRRAKAYRDAGADIIFVDAPQSIEELEIIGKTVDAPLMLNVTEGGKTPILSAKEYEQLGFNVIIYPVVSLYAASKAMEASLRHLKEHGSTAGYLDKMDSFASFNKTIGLPEMIDLEKKYVIDR